MFSDNKNLSELISYNEGILYTGTAEYVHTDMLFKENIIINLNVPNESNVDMLVNELLWIYDSDYNPLCTVYIYDVHRIRIKDAYDSICIKTRINHAHLNSKKSLSELLEFTHLCLAISNPEKNGHNRLHIKLPYVYR